MSCVNKALALMFIVLLVVCSHLLLPSADLGVQIYITFFAKLPEIAHETENNLGTQKDGEERPWKPP